MNQCGMNILLINPVHPATPHISAVRAWRFANELASLGHRVLLLTASRQGQPTASIDALANHDWQQPFIFTCENANEEAGLGARLPKYLRKARTAWRMLRHGGKLGGWTVSAVRGAGGLLGDRFAPDVVWCTFGLMEAVIAAKRIAGGAGCPWVLDIKDNWELYVPRGLRRLMAWRTRGWAAVTANARFTAEKARLWQEAEATVVYSGVDETFFAREPDIDESEKTFCINLIGGVYFREHLESFLKGVGAWADSLSPEQRSRIVVRYLGGDGQLVGEVAQACVPEIEITSVGYLAVDRMAHYCQGAAVNAYNTHSGTFHHKLLELLACGRPVMAYPGERDESRDLAQQTSCVLIEVSDSAQVSSELSNLHRSWLSALGQPASPDPVRRYSWADQARVLEQVLADVVSSS